MTPEQLAASGVTARRLLEWAWATDRRDKSLVVHAIQSVARSYASDVPASGALLRRAIEPVHLAQFGADEASYLANEMKHILPYDPEFVRDVYSALFNFRETSNATSPMGSSRILSLTSTRRQDYDIALYVLGEFFEHFLEHSPECATEAAIAVAEGYVRHEHDRDMGRKVVLEQFAFIGCEATLQHDGSCIWDASSVHNKDDGPKIIGLVGPRIAELVATAPDVARRCLERIALSGRLAIIWRGLLNAGAEAPDTLGLMIRDLAEARPLLTCLDTCTEAGAYLTAVFPLLAEEERTRVEEIILAIPEGKEEDALKCASHRRDILLGCLPRDLLATDATRTRLAELDAIGSVPENAPAFRMEVGWGGEVTTDDWLEREGVDVKAPAHRALLDLCEGLKGLPLTQADIDGNSAASSDVTTKMQSVLDALQDGERVSVDPEVLKAGWGALAETALRVALLHVTCGKAIGALAREVLLKAATRPPRLVEPEVDSQFDEFPCWSTPAPRVTGADGLILLARHSDCVGPDLLKSIERLSRDTDPAVRLQISTRLWLLNETAPELFWKIAERMTESDSSSAVLKALIGQSICRMWRRNPPRALRMATDLLRRFREGLGVNDLRKSCLQLIAGLHVWQEVPEATQALDELLSVRPVSLGDAAHLCTELRAAFLTDEGPKQDEPGGHHVRARAIELVRRLLEPATQELMGIRGDGRSADKWSPEETARFRSLLSFSDLVARELYFATGVFEERTKGDDAKVPTPSQRKRFFEEAKQLLEMVAELGIPSATHHLLEMLEHYIEHSPREAFLLIVRALRAGKWGGYQYESVGQDLFVRFVERYLAEHRSLFQDDQECQSGMLAVLDIFVNAGWPSAQRLSYRLDEIFR